MIKSEKKIEPKEIQESYAHFLSLLANITAAIEDLTAVKGTPEFPVRQEKLIALFEEADRLTERLAEYFMANAAAWNKKRGELAAKCMFFKEASA
ncbi:MAG: hypothetical protein AB2L12_17515 [Smithellaceae bacterium]